MSNPLDKIMGSMGAPASSPSSRSSSSASQFGRIPKRDNRNPTHDGPASKRRPEEREPVGFVMPNSTTPIGRDTFASYDNLEVQMNMFPLSLAKMPPRLRRICFEVTLVSPGGKTFRLNDGLVAVSGDVNSHIRRLAQHTLFRKFFEHKRVALFAGKEHYVAAYDCAATVYIPELCWVGEEDKKLEYILTEKDFEPAEWELVSKLMRKRGSYFQVVVSTAGYVYTCGDQMLLMANRMELTRCIEIITSQMLNNEQYLQFGNSTFNMREHPFNEPDATSEIRAGFAKVARLVDGRNGNQEVLMTIDTKQSPFHKATSVIKFMLSKYAESRGGAGGGGGYGGSYGGRRSDSRDSRGIYGGRGGDYSRERGNDHRDNSRSRDYRDDRGGRRDDRAGRRDSYGGRGGGRDDPRDSRGGDRHSSSASTGQDFDKNEVAELEIFFSKNHSKSARDSINTALNGLYLEATHLPATSNRFINCYGISESNADNTFFKLRNNEEERNDEEERKISVADYFVEKYSIRLKYPKLPLIVSKRLKHASFFPPEVLRIVPGQRIKVSRMSATVQSLMTGRNSSLPQQHVDRVHKILRESLRLERNPYMEAFGVELESTKPVHLNAKILAPAAIEFDQQTYIPEPGRVQFKTQARFVKPAEIRTVAVAVFDRAVDSRQAEDFCDALYRYCKDNGMRVQEKGNRWAIKELDSSDHAGLKRKMTQWRDDKVDILVGLAKEKKPEVHDIMKFYEESLGMQTIQLCAQTVQKMVSPQGGKQTIDNVMRKFNLKCGGTNFHVRVPSQIRSKSICANTKNTEDKLFGNTQFIGFEISHGGARTLYDRATNKMDGEPSIVGVAYSLKKSTSLGGCTYLQNSREHRIQHLQDVIPKCVAAYQSDVGRLPEKIVIYRVGMGEGDFKRVHEEIEEIRSVLEGVQADYRPKLVVIVAQKNSHSRVFPARINGFKSQEQNVPSGTCIDKVVTSVGVEEFILVSQSALIGTVRPCKYTILSNDPAWSKNEIMHLTYFLAFGHQVSYQPPAVPDILYAAENLAKRGKNNYSVFRRFENMQKFEAEVIAENGDLVTDEMREELADAIVTKISDSMNKMTISKRNFWA